MGDVRDHAAGQCARTAGKASKLVQQAGRTHLKADWEDVVYVTTIVADENGVEVPDAVDRIAFQVTGPGAIAAVDSADNASHEPFQARERQANHGECVAILRATGAGGITLTATAVVLKSAEIRLTVQ